MDIKTRRKKRQAFKKRITAIMIAVSTICASVILFYSNWQSETEKPAETARPFNFMLDGFTSMSTQVEEEKEVMQGIINIALFGLDKREEEISRTDTIMIVSADMSNRKLKLISLMRDMYVDIPGKWSDRINAAYAYGGPELALDTINKNFDMDIKYYVTVDFKGLSSIISNLGGVDIDVKEGEISDLNENLDEINHMYIEDFEPHITSPGIQHLMGKQALSYVRIRYSGNGDYERTERQRKVAAQLFDKVKDLGILKLPQFMHLMLPLIETNIPKAQAATLAVNVLTFKNDAEQYRLPVEGAFYEGYISGMAVLLPDFEENARILHKYIYGENKTIPATN